MLTDYCSSPLIYLAPQSFILDGCFHWLADGVEGKGSREGPKEGRESGRLQFCLGQGWIWKVLKDCQHHKFGERGHFLDKKEYSFEAEGLRAKRYYSAPAERPAQCRDEESRGRVRKHFPGQNLEDDGADHWRSGGAHQAARGVVTPGDL